MVNTISNHITHNSDLSYWFFGQLWTQINLIKTPVLANRLSVSLSLTELLRIVLTQFQKLFFEWRKSKSRFLFGFQISDDILTSHSLQSSGGVAWCWPLPGAVHCTVGLRHLGRGGSQEARGPQLSTSSYGSWTGRFSFSHCNT